MQEFRNGKRVPQVGNSILYLEIAVVSPLLSADEIVPQCKLTLQAHPFPGKNPTRQHGKHGQTAGLEKLTEHI